MRDVDHRPLVLVADPDEDVRRILAMALDASGYDRILAPDGDAALAAAHAAEVSVVISELYLPCTGANGLVEALCHDGELRDIPVLVYTAFLRPEDREWARIAGCADLIAKPALPSEVMRRVHALLGERFSVPEPWFTRAAVGW